MQITNEDRARFESLLRVARSGDLALIERINDAGEFVALLASHDHVTGTVEVFGQIVSVGGGTTAVVISGDANKPAAVDTAQQPQSIALPQPRVAGPASPVLPAVHPVQ